MTKHRWLAGIEHLLNNQRRRKHANRRKEIVSAELLETKVLLTADTLGLIQGTVFNDVSDNGLTGEDPLLSGATVQLYRDGGNLSFDNGGADDTLVGAVTTVAGGGFSFPDLASGKYFVRQQAFSGFVQHSGEDVVTIDISPTDALGTPGIVIDEFSLPALGQSLSANASAPTRCRSASLSRICRQWCLMSSSGPICASGWNWRAAQGAAIPYISPLRCRLAAAFWRGARRNWPVQTQRPAQKMQRGCWSPSKAWCW